MRKIASITSCLVLGLLVHAQGLQAQDLTADLSIQMTQEINPVPFAQNGRVRVVIKNAGPDTIAPVRFSFQAAAMSLLSSPGSASCPSTAAPSIECEFASLQSAQSYEFSVQIQNPQNGSAFTAQITGGIDYTDSNPSNNSDSLILNVSEGPSVDDYASTLLQSLPANERARFARAAEVLALYCSGDNFTGGIDGNCDELYNEALNGGAESVARALSWMRPRESVHQAKTAAGMASTQLGNLGARIAQLRAGVQGLSVSGLNFSDGDDTLSAGMLAYLADADGGRSDDQLRSPWGFFINGSLSSGDFRYADDAVDRFDFDSDHVTIGVDRRLSDRSVLGLALGYTQTDSNAGENIRMRSEGLTFSGYALFTPSEAWYLDARLAYAKPDIEQVRVESFSLLGTPFNLTANSETDGSQWVAAINTGYQMQLRQWQFTPSLSIEHLDSDLDGFTETGAGPWNLVFRDQAFKTTKYSLGLQLSRAISLSNGVLQPQLGFFHVKEDQDGSQMEMRLIGMPDDEFFNVTNHFTDDSYSRYQLGLSYIAAGGRQFYLNYHTVSGLNNYSQDTFSLGFRYEFQ